MNSVYGDSDGQANLPGVYVFAVLLYIFPSAFLWAAWSAKARAGFAGAPPFVAGLLPQGCIVCRSVRDGLELLFFSPICTTEVASTARARSLGLWKALGPISAGISVLSFLISAAVRSKGCCS